MDVNIAFLKFDRRKERIEYQKGIKSETGGMSCQAIW